MNFSAIANRINKKLYRREQRRMVQKWYADGGDERFRYDYELNGRSFVMDLGGFEGAWASTIYDRYRCRIVVFEPVSQFAAAIRARFADNEDVEVFHSRTTTCVRFLGLSGSMPLCRAR